MRFWWRRLRRAAGMIRLHHREVGQPRQTALLAWRLARRAVAEAGAQLWGGLGAWVGPSTAPGADGLPVLAISLSGGIGDYLVCARFVRDLRAATEPFTFDLFCSRPSAARWIFGQIAGCRAAHDEMRLAAAAPGFSAVLRLSQFALVDGASAGWPHLARQPRLAQALRHIAAFRSRIDLMVERHPDMDGALGAYAVYSNHTRADFLHAMAKVNYGGDGLALRTDPSGMTRLAGARLPYLTIHNGRDDGMLLATGSSTKAYPHWDEVVRLIKQRWPGLAIVQVGNRTSVPITGVDACLIDATSLEQAAEIVRGALLHLDHESGLVHLARCLGVRSCVVFGPTSADYFGYAGNINLRPRICGGCWWIKSTWMDRCPRGFAEPICTHATPAEDIVTAVLAACGPQAPSASGIAAAEA